MTPAQSTPPANFNVRQWSILVLGIIITAVLALGSHDLAITRLGIPYPADGGVPAWARYVHQAVRLAAMVYFCGLAGRYLDRRSMLSAASIFGLLIVLLQETLRVIIVDNVISEGWVDLRWVYLLMTRLPSTLLSFYMGAVAVVLARKVGFDRPVSLAVAVVIASAVGYFGLLPALKAVADLVNTTLQLTEAPEVYRLPYGFHVYKYIYGTFIEPTISCFILIYLVWPSLEGSKARRIALFVALILLIRGRIVATGLFGFWIEDSWAMAFAAHGQFFVETLILATLTGLTWAMITPPVRQPVDANLPI